MKTQITYPGFCLLALLLASVFAIGQNGQITVNRIELMPDAPSPYQMRDWLNVSRNYDAFVYDLLKTGQYLPLVFIHPEGVNYLAHPSFGLHSYVGTVNPNNGEAINILPSLVGATLCGIDKSDQDGMNWILMSQDYFNKQNGELIYLNNRSGGSGSDWWYDLMPNVYFYQLYDLYGDVGDAQFQFESVASRFAEAVRGMGGSDTPWTRASMNYRAWDFVSMKPNEEGVPEPEAAGAYAWVLYHAYKQLGNPEYLKTAEWSMEFLSLLGTNPSYELQLPYGAYVAAKMNAELQTEYDIEKLVYWIFNRGPLRGWGTIVGNWGGVDVSGLVGEANDQGNDYAFQMNGVQQAGALVPMVRYDKRFCRAVGKWVLNLANATRLMYPRFLPAAQQDASDWSDTYDPDAVLGYEALREHLNGYSPFATGDAVNGGWAGTNLALYGTSSIGYLGSMITTTDVQMILCIDLLKTDFYRDTAYPSYLLYNPYPDERTVTLDVGSELVDIYDALTETYLSQGVAGEVSVSIPGDHARSLVYVPSGGTEIYRDNKLLVNGVVIDYMQSAVAYNAAPRIQALAADRYEIEFGDTVTIYAAAIDPETKDLTYIWSITGGMLLGDGEEVEWVAPGQDGEDTISLIVFDDDGNSDTAQITILAVAEVNEAPEIIELKAGQRSVNPGAVVTISSIATDPNGDSLSYAWSASGGIIQGSGNIVTWQSPLMTGIYSIHLSVQDDQGALAEGDIDIFVYDYPNASGDLIAHYPFDGNALDVSGNTLHGNVSGAKLVPDRFGNPSGAYHFDGINDHITVSNTPILNFNEGITLSCWVKPLQLPDRETFILSHGSWQYRWKLSVIPDKRLRWTVKTTGGPVGDLDSETFLQKDSVFYVSATFDGNYMLLFIDGRLESFRALSGTVASTDIDLEIAQMLPDVQTYNFGGVIDDIRIYNYGLLPDSISILAGNTTTGMQETKEISDFSIYPNPVQDHLTLILGDAFFDVRSVQVFDANGQLVQLVHTGGSRQMQLRTDDFRPGLYFLKIRNGSSVHTVRFIRIE